MLNYSSLVNQCFLKTIYPILIRLTPFKLTVYLWLIQLLHSQQGSSLTRLPRNHPVCLSVQRLDDVWFVFTDGPDAGDTSKLCLNLLTLLNSEKALMETLILRGISIHYSGM